MLQINPKALFGSRIVLSLVIFSLSVIGIIVLAIDQHELIEQEYMEHFEIVFFTIMAIMEIFAACIYLKLWNEAGDVHYVALSQADAMISLLFTILRIIWGIISSIYVVMRRITEDHLLKYPTEEL